MPRYSRSSRDKLYTCHSWLQEIFNKVILTFDCKILEGQRDEVTQNKYFDQKVSKLKWPDSKHNRLPSAAVDAAPWPIDWKDHDRFYYFGGYVKGIAANMGIPLRWGGDWDNDTQTNDQKFKDLVHFEIPTTK